MLIILGPGCGCAWLALFAANTLSPASARETPARAIKRPIKTRRLRNAEHEADFFFMELVHDVDGIKCGAYFVAEPPLTRQHFVCGCPGVYWMQNIWQAFF